MPGSPELSRGTQWTHHDAASHTVPCVKAVRRVIHEYGTGMTYVYIQKFHGFVVYIRYEQVQTWKFVKGKTFFKHTSSWQQYNVGCTNTWRWNFAAVWWRCGNFTFVSFIKKINRKTVSFLQSWLLILSRAKTISRAASHSIKESSGFWGQQGSRSHPNDLTPATQF